MFGHLDAELEDLKNQLLLMGALVESQLQDALQALTTRMTDLALRVVDCDSSVDTLDVKIDEICLRLLALHHPAAGDFRFITTSMKIARELERISDKAVNVAERSIELNQEPQIHHHMDISRIAQCAIRMVGESVEAFVESNSDLAEKVCRENRHVVNLTEQLFRELVSGMLEDRETIMRATRLMFIAKYYEQIADHATNIGELVIYMVEGKIIRHMPVGR